MITLKDREDNVVCAICGAILDTTREPSQFGHSDSPGNPLVLVCIDCAQRLAMLKHRRTSIPEPKVRVEGNPGGSEWVRKQFEDD